jgi:hypothetical protein
MVEILDPARQILTPLPLDPSRKTVASIGSVIEKRTFMKRHHASVVSRFSTNKKPSIEPKIQESVKDGHRYALGPAAFVCSIDDHDLTKI